MKVFTACLATETNTFSPIPTGRRNFEETFLAYGDGSSRSPMFFTSALHVWKQAANDRDWDFVESLSAVAQPAGTTVKSVYETFCDRILSDLEAAGPCDIILLSLHGAMVAEHYPDCEGDLLGRIRSSVGTDPVIGALLDPHAHLTPAMIDNSDLLVFYKEFPHTDIEQRAEDLFTLAADCAKGSIKPIMCDVDCRMLALYHTPEPPMRGFVDRMLSTEGSGDILSLSLVHGFPWGDHPRTGSRMLAIADGNAGAARSIAEEFAAALWQLREDLRIDYPPIDVALTQACEVPEGLVVLADVADNPGGGAPGDSTFLLQAILERGIRDVALGIFWDPTAVRMCEEAGEGARVRFRIGGKVGEASGQPVDLDVRVHRIAAGLTQPMGGSDMPLGTLVWAEADGVHLLLNDLRTQVFHPEAFTGIGVALADLRMVVVKSTQHFYAGFAPLAAEIIYVATPGALTMDFARIPYVHFDRQVWPIVEHPGRSQGTAA